MTPARIRRAAEVLRDEAQCLKESYGRPPLFEWPEDEDVDDADRKARADHDEMVELAGELDAHAAEQPRGEMVVVPVEPTADMLDAGGQTMFVDVRRKHYCAIVRRGYRAMLDARPKITAPMPPNPMERGDG